MIDAVAVGKKITKLRRSLDLSQEELANKLFISRTLISKWENGVIYPSYSNMEKLFFSFS